MIRPVAVITGGNSGVGLAIAHRLLAHTKTCNYTLVLACRNQTKGQTAQTELLDKYPQASVDLVPLDTNSVESVKVTAQIISSRYERVDLLFCNAGAMSIRGLDIPAIITGILTHPVPFFESSEALKQKKGVISKDGLGEIFQTNVFGHYLLIDQLLPLLSRSGTRIIWTGSSASKLEFSKSDYQHVWGVKSYESSKYIVDQISIPLHKRLTDANISCYVTEPGNVCTNFLAGLNQPILELLIVVAFYFIRTALGLARFTITADKASIAGCYVALADEEELDPRIKYHSQVTRLGRPYVKPYPLVVDQDTSSFVIERLDTLVSKFS